MQTFFGEALTLFDEYRVKAVNQVALTLSSSHDPGLGDPGTLSLESQVGKKKACFTMATVSVGP